MRCRFCKRVFDESKRIETCRGCMGSEYKMVKCPNCGYKNLSG